MTPRPRLRPLGRDLAVDLGTANTLIHVRGQGVVVEEPSVVAVDVASGRLVAAGTRAKEMLGRAPGTIRAARPLRDGVVSDADETEAMLRWFIDQVRTSRLVRPRMVLCVPSKVTGVERRALEDAATRCGARRVYMVEEPMAAAIGAGLPVHETAASMVVDIGGGTTDVAVISLGGIVTSSSLRIGGGALLRGLDERMRHELGVPVRVAEDPLRAVARGAGRCVDDFAGLERLLVGDHRL